MKGKNTLLKICSITMIAAGAIGLVSMLTYFCLSLSIKGYEPLTRFLLLVFSFVPLVFYSVSGIITLLYGIKQTRGYKIAGIILDCQAFFANVFVIYFISDILFRGDILLHNVGILIFAALYEVPVLMGIILQIVTKSISPYSYNMNYNNMNGNYMNNNLNNVNGNYINTNYNYTNNNINNNMQ